MKKSIIIIYALLFALAGQATEENLYHYRAELVSAYDGDTVRINFDLGLGVWIRNTPIRLYGINAPEVRGSSRSAGIKSRDFLRAVLKDSEIIVKTHRDKKGKYGRWLADILIKGKGGWCPQDEWCNVNVYMVHSKHAVFKDY